MPRDPQDTPRDRATARPSPAGGGSARTPGQASSGGSAASGGRTVGGRYRVVEVLGRGGMGVVWSGHDEVLHREVAIKEVALPAGMAGSDGADAADADELRARTLREARSAARVSAAGVVAVYDVVEDDGRLWIVMEMLPPRTLEDELAERGGLPPEEVAQIGTTLLAGLMAAHAVGVLHRDVKPSNVMFRDGHDGRRAVLADFGIALFDGDASITATGLMVGSPAYIAPERARGGAATPASDLWSLGVTLWAAVEGRSPFLRENSLASLTAVITEQVPRPTRAGPLAPVLQGLLRKDPSERIDAATARRLLADALPPPGTPTERLGVATTQPLAPPPADEAGPDEPAGPVEPATSVPASATEERPGTAPVSAAPPPWWDPHEGEEAEETQRPERRRRRLLPAAVAVAVVAVVAVGAAIFQPFGGDSPGPTQASPEVTAPAPPEGEREDAAESEAEPEPEPEPEPDAPEADGTDGDGGAEAPAEPEAEPAPQGGGEESGSADVVPAGFERHKDPTGFSVVVPAGWRAERDGPRVYFRDPGSRAYLMVDQTDSPQADPVADWQRQEPAVAERLENYTRVGEIEATDFRGWQAADWQFVFGPDQNTRVLNRNVLVSPDQAYALYWSVPSSQWDALQPVHQQVVASFQPAQ